MGVKQESCAVQRSAGKGGRGRGGGRLSCSTVGEGGSSPWYQTWQEHQVGTPTAREGEGENKEIICNMLLDPKGIMLPSME